MRSPQLFLLLAFLMSLSSFSFGQDKRTSKVFLTKKFNHFTNTDATLNHQNFFDKMGVEMKLAPGSEMVLAQEIPGHNGFAHFKYRQYHEGLLIFGNSYILHEKNGIIKSANGHYTPMAQMDITPSFNVEEALKLTKVAVQAKTYADHQPTPTLLLIDPAFPKASEQLRLAYQVDLETAEPYNKVRYMLDAIEGTIITEFPLLHAEGVPSTGHTKYYGVQDIITDSVGPQSYRLHDPTRGEGITILNNMSGEIFTHDSHVWDLTNEAQDEVALDAHLLHPTVLRYDAGKFWLARIGRRRGGIDRNGP